MIKKNSIIFSITTLILTGGILSMFFGVFLPEIISNFSSFPFSVKTAFVILIGLYILLAYCSIYGNYLLLNKDKLNPYLVILTVLFCLSFGVNNANFKFLLFSIDFNINLNFTEISLRPGINVIGIFFVFWLNWLKHIYSFTFQENNLSE